MFAEKRGVVPPERRKVLYFGTDMPSVAVHGPEPPAPESLAGNLARLRALPFDGLSVQIYDWHFPWPQAVVGHNLFGTHRYEYGLLAKAVPQLKRLREAPNLTDNFLLVACCYWFESGATHNLDLFSDARWATILHNVGAYARVAREAGTVKGLILDIEPYDGPPRANGEPDWAFSIFSTDHLTRFVNALPGHPDRAGAYRAQARKRGRQFWEAVARNFPAATLFLYFGNNLATLANYNSRPDLFPHFLDGILEQMEALRSTGYVVDGYEGAYTFREAAQYQDARAQVLARSKALSSVPALYEKYVRVGFGKWLDAENRWDAGDAGKNFFPPAAWRETLAHALRYADEYVWLWAGGQARVFAMSGGRNVNVPAAYLDAVRAARPRKAATATTKKAAKPAAKAAKKPAPPKKNAPAKKRTP